jgi:cystathionine beta-lyase
MNFDFDRAIPRQDTDSQKWQKYAGRDILPMWVADMDFAAAPSIVAALRRRIDHGVFGYARPVPSTTDAMVSAMLTRYGWTIQPEWIVWLPGLVCGLNVTARAFAAPGEEVLSLTPVYPPFQSGPKQQDRAAVPVPLVLSGGRWIIDWDGLEKAVTPRTRLFYFCHPHNPVARVWRPQELVQLAAFCARHGLILCSDEIHCDLILEPALRRHVPAAVAAPDFADRTITLMAPSKAYNIPGLSTSFAIIPDGKLRARFVQETRGIVAEVTSLGFAACEAAYDGSAEPWREKLLDYLRGNRDLLVATLAKDFPAIKLEAPMEATYLAWLNVEALGLSNPLAHFEAKGVGLTDGAPFGVQPGKYVRINLGCTRATLTEALRRMA